MNPIFQRVFDNLQLHATEMLAVCKHALVSDSVSSAGLNVTELEQRVMLSASPLAAAAEPAQAPEIETSPRAVVFVDAAVPDLDNLLNEANLATRYEEAEIVVLSSDEDGIAQISNFLNGRSDIEAIHIVSHGTNNGITLGSVVLSDQNISTFAGEVAGWRTALSVDADLLIYGCDLASSDNGRDLVESLSALTDSDVAASDDKTGHSELGGDWELEHAIGFIENEVAYSGEFQSSWQNVLPDTPPVADAGGPYFMEQGGTVTLDGSASSDDNAITLYEWDFDYSGTFGADVSSTSATAEYTSTLPGPNTVTIALRVTDSTGATAVSTQTINITAPKIMSELWFATKEAVSVPGVNGNPFWTEGTTLKLSGAGLNLEPGTTAGDVSMFFNWDFVGDGNTDIAGIHYVSRDITVGGANAVNLKAGDILYSFEHTENFSSGIQTLNVSEGSIILLRPGNGSAVISLLFEDVDSSQVGSFTLVEQDTLIGDTTVQAGDLLYVTSSDEEKIKWFQTTDVGVATTSGTSQVLIDGGDLGITDQISALSLAENTISVGGHTLTTGDIVLSLDNSATVEGVSTKEFDVFSLDFTATTLGSGTAVATAELFLEGFDIGLDSQGEAIGAFSFGELTPNPDPVASDDSYVVNEGGTLTTLGGTWFDSNWTSRQKLVIDNTNSTSALIDFPVLVKLNTSNIDYSKTQSSGQDLRFVDAKGNQLSYEIENWNPAGESTVWVRVPKVDIAASENIWIYYNNATATAGENAGAVWSGQYEAVYHLNDDKLDSTTNNVDPTGSSSTNVVGFIGDAEEFDGDTNFINVGSNTNVDNIFAGGGTVSAWVKLDSFGENGLGRILDKASGVVPSPGGWSLGVGNASGQGRLIFEAGFSSQLGRWQTSLGTISLSTWHHIAVTFDSDTSVTDPIVFIDGVEVALSQISNPIGTSVSDSGLDLAIGNHFSSANRTFDGTIDEVRISSSAQTPEEIESHYETNSTTIGTFMGEETFNSPLGVLANDIDPDDDSLVAAKLTNPQFGTVTMNSDGSFTYVHDGSENFTDSFTYQVSDGRGGFDSATVHISITDLNDAPSVSLSNTTPNVEENASTTTGLHVADINIADDALGTNGLSLSGVDATSFEIVGTQLRLKAGVILDFEIQSTYDVTVNVDDPTLGTAPDDSVAFTLSLIDINKAPSFSIVNHIGTIPENTDTSGMVKIADIQIEDDALGTNTLTLSGTNAASFEIIGNELFLRMGVELDFETEPVLDIVITLEDTSISFSDAKSTQLNISDAQEAPVFVGPAVLNLTEDDPQSDFDASTWFTDDDAADSDLTYTIANMPADWLTYSIGNSDVLHLSTGPDVFGTTEVVVRATDTQGLFTEQTISIDVANVNDTVTVIDQDYEWGQDGRLRGRLIDSVIDIDGENLTLDVTKQTQDGNLRIFADGRFSFKPKKGFSGPTSFQFVANDGVATSNVATVTIEISPDGVILPEVEEPTIDTEGENGGEGETQEIATTDPSGSVGVREESTDNKPKETTNAITEVETEIERELPQATFESEGRTNIPTTLVFANRPVISPAIDLSDNSQLASSPFANSNVNLTALSQTGALWQQLDQFHESATRDISLSSMKIGSVGTATSGLIVGYVIWALRSGLLMSSLMAAMPAWNLLDPLAIVSVAERSSVEGESLEDIVEAQKRKIDETTEV